MSFLFSVSMFTCSALEHAWKDLARRKESFTFVEVNMTLLVEYVKKELENTSSSDAIQIKAENPTHLVK